VLQETVQCKINFQGDEETPYLQQNIKQARVSGEGEGEGEGVRNPSK
jgi:hypothetical protein